MALSIKEKGGDFKLLPEGTHIAICNMVVDLGIQKSFYGPKHKVYLRWETPDERMDVTRDDQKINVPMSIGAVLSPSLSKKATLRGLLESWRGREFTKEELQGFDLFTVLGAPCQIAVIHQKADNGNVYANIKAIIPLPKGMARTKPENQLLKYSPDDAQDFEKLPEWLQTKINEQVSETPEDEPATQNSGSEFKDDDIPF